MNIIVVGAGAIGTLYGAKLAADNAVTLVSRIQRDSGAQAVQITGLEDAIVTLSIASAVHAIEANTLVLLTTKAYDSVGAVTPLVQLLRSDTVILSLQNGLYVEEDVRRVVGSRCVVLRGVTYFGSVLVSSRVVSLRATGRTSIESSVRSNELADLFSRCGLDGRVSDDIKREVWKKTIFTAVINPLTAMTRMEVGWISDERLDPLKQCILDECLSVAEKDGVALDLVLMRAINETFRPSRNLSSMHQDLLRGRRTEIDFLNGAIVEVGRRYGIDCPVNRSLGGRSCERVGKNDRSSGNSQFRGCCWRSQISIN